MMTTIQEFSLSLLAQRAEEAGLRPMGFLDRSSRDAEGVQQFRRFLLESCASTYFRGYLEGGLQHWTRRWEYPWVLGQVARFAQHHPGCRLLDDACGVNAVGYLLASGGCRLTGTDLDGSASAEGDLPSTAWAHPDTHGLAGTMEFQAADSQQLPFPDASFDGGYSISSLEHMSDPVQAVRELVRVVRPGGLVVITMDVSEGDEPRGGEGNVNRHTFPSIQAIFTEQCIPFADPHWCVPGDTICWSRDCRRSGMLRHAAGGLLRSLRRQPLPGDFSVWCGAFQRR